MHIDSDPNYAEKSNKNSQKCFKMSIKTLKIILKQFHIQEVLNSGKTVVFARLAVVTSTVECYNFYNSCYRLLSTCK